MEIIIKFIVYTITYLIGMPTVTLLHELGHAIMQLIFTKRPVNIIIGNGKLNIKFTIKRLTVSFKGYENILALSCGFSKGSKANSKIKNILIYAGGPIVSTFICIITYFILSKLHLNLLEIYTLNALFWFSLSSALLTIIPMKYNYYPYDGYFSDGYAIKELISKKRSV